MRIRAALPVTVLTCAASACMGACTSGAKPGGHTVTPPSGDVVVRAEKTPLTFGAKPLWTDRTKGVPHHADHFTVHRDRVIMYSGPKGGESDRLSVLDAATGRRRWSVRIWRPLPGGHGDVWAGRSADDPAPQVVDRGRDWGVLIPTARHGKLRQAGYGVALLSGEDGRPLWRRPVVAPKELPAREVYVHPGKVLTDGGAVVVSLLPSYGGKVTDLRLVGLDALSGKRLWSRTGLLPAAVSRSYVIAEEWSVPASTTLDRAGTGTVTVLDESTGRARWSLRGRMPAARMAATAGGLLLVRGEQGGSPAPPIALDLATGAEAARMPGQTGTCADDHADGDRTDLIACAALSPEPRLVTIRSDERKVRVAGHTPPGGDVISVVRDGRIYYSGADQPGQEVDRSGTPLGGRLPDGFLSALDDEYAVFGLPARQTYQVYRVG